MTHHPQISSYAIDFGTSNTVVAHWNPITQTQETLKLPGFSTEYMEMPPLIPSLVYVEDALSSQGVALQNHLYHNYGIRYWNWPRQRHDWQLLIGSGQPYPMEESVEIVLGATSEDQAQLELILGEMGSNLTQTAVYFEGDQLITQVLPTDQVPVKVLNTRHQVIPLNSPGVPGKDRIRLLFWVDGDRILRMTVEDKRSKWIILLENEPLIQIR